jgi:uncharacterized protein
MFSRWRKFPENRSILLIGPRRSGKTTLLKSRFPDYKYATLDDFDLLHWAHSDPKGLVASLGKRMIIDEIQRCPQLTVAVKHAIDENGARVMMSGSSTLGLLDAAADSLAGRIEIVSLPTACWGEEEGAPTHEILGGRANPAQLAEANRRLETALAFGQFPELLGLESDEEKRQLLRMYRDTYFMRDLMQLASLENAEGLRVILHHLCRSIGSHLEVAGFAREAGISVPTAKKYLNSLVQAQLVFKLHGYPFAVAKRFIKAAKSYFCDVGVMQSLNAGPSVGQVLENFVLAELEKRRKLGFIDSEGFHFFKTPAGMEVDAVWEDHEGLTAVEVKSSQRVGEHDMRKLNSFGRRAGKPCRRFLFYRGLEYIRIGEVEAVPIAALWRGR